MVVLVGRQTTTVFDRVRQSAAPWQSLAATYDWLVVHVDVSMITNTEH